MIPNRAKRLICNVSVECFTTQFQSAILGLSLVCRVLIDDEECLLGINDFRYASNVHAQFLFPCR